MVNQRITARDVAFYIGSIRVGGAEDMTLTIDKANEPAHEAGNHFPVEIVDGKITITGDLNRAFIDVDLLNTIAPSDTGIWPAFTITAQIVTGKTPGRTVSVLGAKFDGFDINNLTLDGYAKNKLGFKALKWKLDAE